MVWTVVPERLSLRKINGVLSSICRRCSQPAESRDHAASQGEVIEVNNNCSMDAIMVRWSGLGDSDSVHHCLGDVGCQRPGGKLLP
jgi:hypothetical protein